MLSEKWIGVHTGGPHYLDHLGVLCAGLEIPLIVSEKETFQVARQFYPDLQVEYRDLSEMTLDFFAQQADAIFESGHYFAKELIPLCELLYGKKIRVVYCPHGNSDKNPGMIQKDISLIYGDHMKSLQEKTGENHHIGKTVVSGNYRALYYDIHRSRLDKQLEGVLKKQIITGKKTVLYAPTYDATSFSSNGRVIEEIASSYNLLIRWHPFLEDLYPAENERMKYLCKKTPGIIDLSSFPSIYPILHRADFYLGDASSVGYDFLTFNKPLFFLGKQEGEIYACGVSLQENEHWADAICRFQDSRDLAEKRERLAERVFGRKRSFKEIKEEIKQALSVDRACWTSKKP